LTQIVILETGLLTPTVSKFTKGILISTAFEINFFTTKLFPKIYFENSAYQSHIFQIAAMIRGLPTKCW